jgi:O-antigen/teichoic acid export membrane protein
MHGCSADTLVLEKMMTSKFRSDTAIYGLAQVVERLISFFLLSLLTKATSVEEYGVWSQLIIVVGISTPVLLLGLQTALVRYLPRWRHALQVRHSLILSVFGAVACVMLVMAIGFVAFQRELGAAFFGSPAHSTFVLLLIGFITTEVLFELLVAVLRADGVIRRISYYMLLKGMIRIGVFLFMVEYQGASFESAVFTLMISQIGFVLLLALFELPVRRIAGAGLQSSRPHWGETLRFALPMVALALLTGLNNSADRFFLTHFLGVHEVAVYAAAYSLAGIAGLVYSMLGFTLFPAMSACWAEGRRDVAAQLLGKTVQVYLFFLLPFVLALGICGPELLVLLATHQYHLSGLAFFLLAAAVGLFGLYQVAVFAVILEGRSIDSMLLMGLAAMVSLGLNAVFIPLWGVVGAALATCLANGLLALHTAVTAGRILTLAGISAGLVRIATRASLMGLLLASAQTWLALDAPQVLLPVVFLAGVVYLAMDYWGGHSVLRMLLPRG